MSDVVDARKQLRMAGSCDFCRKRKIKCDSSMMPNNLCSNCISNNKPCTHELPVKKRGVKNYAKQVDELQQKVQDLEAALRARDKSASLSPKDMSPALDNEDPDVDEEYVEMLNDFKRFSLDNNSRYFGPSSNIYFMCKMMDSTPSMNGSLSRSGSGKKWTMHPWETGMETVPRRQLIFPDHDLLENLIDIYFGMSHFVPILHEPSFRRDVQADLHHIDDSFGFVVLLVCALASRGTTDPRVLVDGASKHSAGWKYFVQTTTIPRPLFSCPTIHDIQFCVLYLTFCIGTSTPHSNWTILGIGIRYAIELGYHRRHHGAPTIESEFKKRAFWCLVYLDRNVGLYFGRPCSIRDEDFDLDFPIECDDVYMYSSDSVTDFKQPPGKPSLISAFNHILRQVNIVSVVMKTIYGTKKSKQAAGSDDESVSMIDSMLNSWFNAIPEHLRWDHAQNTPYSFLSSMLHISYYDLQIFVHRPFLYKTMPQAFPSTAICTNAARTLSRMLETTQLRHACPYFFLEMTTFSAGMILVTNIRKRRQLNPLHLPGGQDLQDLYRCMRVLGSSEESYSICGRLRHTLEVLADLPTCDIDTLDLNQPSLPVPTSFAYAVSGYASNTPPDLKELDPTLFGLIPPPDAWASYAKPDMSLFDVEEDVNVWSQLGVEGGNVEGGSWVQDPNWSGELFNEAMFSRTLYPLG